MRALIYVAVNCLLAWLPLAMALERELKVWKALELKGAPENENLATLGPAMEVWTNHAGVDAGPEFVIAQTHQYWNIDARDDDKQFVVAWESNGTHLTEKARVELSCADVSVTVPSRGPYVYEARMIDNGFSMHPECSCQPSGTVPCPRGAQAQKSGTSWSLDSVIASHFVVLENEWEERIADRATLASMAGNLNAIVKVVSAPLRNLTGVPVIEPIYACPGTRDDAIGNTDVTKGTLQALDRVLPDGHVTGKWCLVKRGFCSETAKAKVCELSGAIGIIIVDHGNEPLKDQLISVRFNRAAQEVATKPVLFTSAIEGAKLISEAASGADVYVAIGPAIGGMAPPNYNPGSGINVHTLGLDGKPRQFATYSTIFSTMAWLEVSAVRDLMFVCLPQYGEIRIYDCSKPMQDLPQVGAITQPCHRRGTHDYRVIDYLDASTERYKTLLIDPFDSGNRLYYYDTQDPGKPSLDLELHARWESPSDGLGQVKVGGLGGRYHMVTWHCSDVYCDKNHGDALYVLDTQNLTASAIKVPLPQLTKGSIVRDVGCDKDGYCLVSLTWDGLVAVDSGVAGTVNKDAVVAEYIGKHPFSSDSIPRSWQTLKLYSGAQKIYPSKRHARRYYVEHQDLELRPLRVGDVLRALELKQVWIVELRGYDATVKLAGSENGQAVGVAPLPQSWLPQANDSTAFFAPVVVAAPLAAATDEDSSPVVAIAIGAVVGLMVVAVSVLAFCVFRMQKKSKAQQAELDLNRAAMAGSSGMATGENVVVGRPVATGDAGAVEGAPQATAGDAKPQGKDTPSGF